MSNEPSRPVERARVAPDASRRRPVRERPGRPVPTARPGAAGASGSGRRDRSRATDHASERRPFLERHRGEILGLVAVAAIVLAGGFVFVQANSKAYACTTLTDPAPAATAAAERLAGAARPGPAGHGSRPHPVARVPALLVLPAGLRATTTPRPAGRSPRATTDPTTPRLPQGWIHNLEHGGLVILYSCDKGACDDATQQALQDLFKTFPDSPVCKHPEGQRSAR